jgi:hypothetical protein
MLIHQKTWASLSKTSNCLSVGTKGDLVNCNPDLAPISHYGCGASPDFLAKILGVDT